MGNAIYELKKQKKSKENARYSAKCILIAISIAYRDSEERSPIFFAIREISIVLIWSNFTFESFGRFASPEGIKTSKERITFVLDVSGIIVIVPGNFYSKTYFHFALHFLFLTFQPKIF